jgi:LysM domain
MPTTTNGRSGTRFLGATISIVAVVVGLPALLVAVARMRFDHVSPLHGMNAPWRWSTVDMHAWGHRLTKGLDSSAEVVDLFLRAALVVGWICVAVLIYTMVDEMVFQLRHGMPSARHRRLGGLAPLGRRLATVLIAVLPLTASATPTLAGPLGARAVAGVVQHRVADFAEPAAATVMMPAVVVATAPSNLGDGWSLVEVQRGDSIWAIAQHVADGRDVADIAQQIVSANLGTVMNDGHRFSTPALIEPGWLLNVPVAGLPFLAAPVAEAPRAAIADSYVVVPGDSYWRIAEEHLDPATSNGDIAAYTRQLVDINAPVLGYSNTTLIRPGDVIELGLSEPPPIFAPPIFAPPTVLPLPVVAGPVITLPPPVAVDPSAAVEVPSTPALQPTVIVTPGADTTVENALPAPLDAAIAGVFDNGSNDDVAMHRGLATAVLLAGGAIAVLDARRRQQLRGAQVGARLSQPTDEAVDTEILLRSLSPIDRLARIDLALRSAAPELAGQRARVLAAEVAEDGEIRLYIDGPTTVPATHWFVDSEAHAWRLPSSVSLADLADDARRSIQPCPAIVHIGQSAGGDLFVDLEAVGLLSVDAEPAVAASIVRCAAASLAVSPFAEASRVFAVGLEVETQLGNLSVESHNSLPTAVEAVRATVGSMAPATSGGVTTFALRAAAHGGEAWEPSMLLVVGVIDPEGLASLVPLAGGGGRGVGAMVDRMVPGCGAVLRAADGDFVLEPLGRRVTPVGLSTLEVSAVDNLLELADRPLLVEVESILDLPATNVDFVERQHALVVHVLGHVDVQSAKGEPVGFDRSKSQELVVWLSQHRHRPTRTSARTALWDLAVRDATFSNVVSDARRAMAKVVLPPPGQEWIGRTMNEELPLHDMVVSDAELLAQRVDAARGREARDAIAVLRPGVALIHGMPFAGTSYLWPDAEGITSALVLTATSAAADLAFHYLAMGDIDGVFWSTGQGLKVLAGHEELIALRMRAHAHRGDLAGVRSEWESYERAIHADTWAAAEPSPKLIDLRRELLSPSLAS